MPQLTKQIYKARKSIDPQNPEAYKTSASVYFGKGILDHDKLVSQIRTEYEAMWWAQKNKIDEGLTRLKLYNNQAREKTDVGDPMLFTNHQTVIASLYYDRLDQEFMPREEGDVDSAQALNYLAKNDYDDMNKAELDYYWDWDAGAFGRGLIYFDQFDRTCKTPVPSNLDALTFLRDPDAKSVNGGRDMIGQMRFAGFEVNMTRAQMEDHPEYFNVEKVRSDGNDLNGLVDQAKLARDNAQGRTNSFYQQQIQNANYKIYRAFTHIDGEKYIVELANKRTLIVRVTPLLEAKDEPAKLWPIIDRPLFPMSNDWDGVSVFDIVEDKQRFRAALLNIYGKSAKAALLPMYIYDTNKIDRKTDFKFGFNKFIGVNGNPNDVVSPLVKSQQNQQAQFIFEFLDAGAQRALATPDFQQGVPDDKSRTLGEIQIVAGSVGRRYSLTQRVFGWSEKRFWKRWYEIYDRDFEDGLDKKIVRITGLLGPKFMKIKRKDITANNPLGYDLYIESTEIANAKKQRDYVNMSSYFAGVLSDPNADKMYALRKLGKLLMPKEEVERILPLTVDERIATKENGELSINKGQEVKIDDDHNAHLRIHIEAKDTSATRKHIQLHEEMIILQKSQPQVFAPPGMVGGQMPGQTDFKNQGAMSAMMANKQPNEMASANISPDA